MTEYYRLSFGKVASYFMILKKYYSFRNSSLEYVM
jgi:hypothetical protein